MPFLYLKNKSSQQKSVAIVTLEGSRLPSAHVTNQDGDPNRMGRIWIANH